MMPILHFYLILSSLCLKSFGVNHLQTTGRLHIHLRDGRKVLDSYLPKRIPFEQLLRLWLWSRGSLSLLALALLLVAIQIDLLEESLGYRFLIVSKKQLILLFKCFNFLCLICVCIGYLVGLAKDLFHGVSAIYEVVAALFSFGESKS